jgi:hypothetical protein
MMPTYGYPHVPAVNPFISQPYHIPQQVKPAAVKRDAAGNVIKPPGQGKNVPTTAAAAATAVAAASIEMENKNKKAKEAAKEAKKKKIIRAAGGQVWEDETLAEWDPGTYDFFKIFRYCKALYVYVYYYQWYVLSMCKIHFCKVQFW